MEPLDSQDLRTYSRYSQLALPRHTSYPAVPYWNGSFTLDQIEPLTWQTDAENGLSLYFHIPFCQKLCFYCGCSKEIRVQSDPKTQDRVTRLIEGFAKEIKAKAKLYENRKVSHIHFGGGTPTFLNQDQWKTLWGLIRQAFDITDHAEVAIEIDPRTISKQALSFLKGLGINRISLGVQDFDPKVQSAINRIQPFDMVASAVAWARELNFASINFDLIYGLPFQTESSVSKTLDQVIDLNPDRIAYYRLAVIPDMFKWQKTFLEKDLPSGLLPLKLNLLAIEKLGRAGYEFLGLDHFAKPSDELSQAYESQSLHRNFQGMTAGRDKNILGFGPTAISDFGRVFFQNPRTLEAWLEAVSDSNHCYKSHHLSRDDQLRRELVQGIYTYGHVDIQNLEDRFQIHFQSYFAHELEHVRRLENDGIVQHHGYMIKEVGLNGRLLRRVFASAFDHYLPQDRFTKGIPGKASQVG
ncbi:MAG: oxygen-independent coproporphyrinogen III oxidase [Pseudobacteriovorax sp.]|nr:oxygen-independent coproporphyrinogen III oxidase [Pseudobacteriovorax sp.]